MLKFSSGWIKNVLGVFDREIEEDSIDLSPDSFFTRSELDQLKVVLSEAIRSKEEEIISYKSWISSVSNDIVIDDYYHLIRKTRNQIKRLANLSHKVKHKLVVLG